MAGALNRRDIEMIFRADTTKATRSVGELSKEAKNLRGTLNDLVEAAAKGDVSLDKLADTTRDLKAAQDELGTARSLVTQLNSQAAALDKAANRTEAATAKFEQYKAQLAGADKPTKRLQTATEAAGRAASKAAEDEERLKTEVAELRTQIEAIVGPVSNFEETFKDIATASKDVGRGLAIAGEAADEFKAKIAAMQAQQAKASATESFVQSGVDAGLLRTQIEYLSQFENRVELLAQAKRELATQNANFEAGLRAQEAREGADNLKRLEQAFKEAADAEARLAQVDAFRKVAQDARASLDDVGKFAPRMQDGAQSAERLADAILKIVDPSRAAGLSIQGIEESTEAAAAVLSGKGKRSLQEYNQALNELSQANAALGRLAGDLDTFKQQEAAAQSAAAEFERLRQEALDLANAFDPAADNAGEMASRLTQAESAVEQAGKEMQRLGEIAETTAAKLRRAGIDSSQYEQATKELTEAAKQSRAAIDEIEKKTGRNGAGPLGFSLQDTQNLSYQINDLVTQIASGTPPMQAFAQQFGQIYQIPAIQNLIGQFAAFIPLIAAATAALGVMIAALDKAQDRVKGLREINAAIAENTSATRYDPKQIQAIIDDLDRLGISAKEARDSVNALVREGVDTKYIADIGTAAVNLNKATDALGADVPEVTKRLVEAFTEGKDGVLELDDAFHFLEPSQRAQIEAAKDGALAADLQTMAFNALYNQAQDVAQQLEGPGVASARALENAWADLLTQLGDTSAFSAIKSALDDIRVGVALTIRVIAGFLKTYGPALMEIGKAALNPVKSAIDLATGNSGLANAIKAAQSGPAEGIIARARADTLRDLANDPTRRRRTTGSNPFRGVQYRGNEPRERKPRKPGKSDAEREAERIAKQIESLTDQLTNSLDQMNASVARAALGSIEEQLANAKRAVDSQYAKLYRDLEELNKLSQGRAQINGMTIAQYRQQLDTNKELLTNVAQLKVYEDGVNELLKQRNTLLSNIEAKAQNGQLSASEAARAAAEVTSRLNPMIANLSAAGIGFANGLKDAKLSPEVQQFLAVMGRSIGDADSTGPASALGKFFSAQLGREESALNSIISERNALIEANNTLMELGLKTQVDARTDAANAFKETQPRIQAQIDSMREMIEEQHALGQMTDTVYSAWIAKLQAVEVQSQYVDERILAMNNAVQGAFVNGFTSMFDTLAQGLANLVTGAGDVGDMLADLGIAALQFAADFLKAMADVLVQMLAIQAVKSIFGASSGGIGAFFFHGGTGPGGVGDVSGGARRRSGLNVPAAALAAIPRYHTGTPGAGLGRDETLAVLERGEKVMTEEQQRQEAKQMAAARANGGGRPLKQVLAFGDDQVAEAMAGPAGEDVTVTHIRKNRTRIRQELGIR